MGVGEGAGNFPAGFYDHALELELPANVRYTLDGSTPTGKSPVYDDPLSIEQTTVVRYATFDAAGQQTGSILGGTYFIGEPPTKLLTLSVGIDPWRLFDGASGWFQAGHGADPGHWKQPGANWWTKQEHPAHLDLIETDGTAVFSGTTGFRMFGGMSRLHPQKSFSLSARERYGKKRIKHQLFGDDAGKSFQFLVARNAGSDWNRAYLRDALLTDLLQDESWDLERQAARPVQVYLNGKYWGIYHLREKINPQFLKDRHPDINKNALDLLEHEESVKHGQAGDYLELVRFMERNDLSQPANYKRLGELMDTDNYMRLQIAQTYFDNRDAGGNIRYWKEQRPGSRWRWILYDVDQGFGLHQEDGYKRNTLAFFTEADGPAWPNPPWSTLFQRKLLTNLDYRRSFVNRTLDYLHTDFAPVTVAAATERRVATLKYDMPRQLARWKGEDKNWQLHLDRVRDFGRERPAYLREHLRAFFDAGDDRSVELIARPGGYVEVNNNIRVDEENYTASYFQNFPLHLRAVAHKGFRFMSWEGVKMTDAAFDLYLSRDLDYRLIANFEPFDHPMANRVIFNEIHPRGKAGGDWIELHNRSDVLIDLTGWQLNDAGHECRLPAARIAAGDYLVVCRDVAAFRAAHPTAHNVVAGLTFGLDKDGERLGLYGPDGGYVNAMAYETEVIDSAFVHALVLPGLDNTDARHWAVQSGAGTPCAANPEYLEAAIITTQDYWLRIGIGVGLLLLLVVMRAVRG
jgi:hypothetical protein